MKIYVDANIIIYLHEGTLETRSLVAHALAKARDGMIVTSEISIVECLYGSFRQQKPILAEKYRSFFRDEEAIALTPILASMLELAAKLGADYALKTIDAIHVASALSSGCDAFLTNDKRLRAPAGLTISQLGDS